MKSKQAVVLFIQQPEKSLRHRRIQTVDERELKSIAGRNIGRDRRLAGHRRK